MTEVFTKDGEMYAQFFLYNNEMNNAGDPIKFKIYPEKNEKISNSFIGRPYLLPAKDKDGKWTLKHHRADTLDELLNKQRKFAAAEIVKVYQNPETGNFNAVAKVFPEYYDIFRKGDIPPFTSPMFAQSEYHIDEEGQMHIKDGIGVHLQGVISPGYSPDISSVMSICEAGLTECMNELKIVAASGKLQEFQNSKSFSNEENGSNQSIMSQQQQQAPPAQAGQAPSQEERLSNLEKGLAELTKQLQMILQKLSGQAAAPPTMAGAAAQTEEPESIKAIRTDLDEVKNKYEAAKKELDEEKQTLFLQERTRVATEIVEAKLKLHKLPLENKEAEIKKLVELKNGENFVDLTLLHDEVISSLKAFVGASGENAVYSIPELGADNNENQADYASLIQRIG